MTDHYKQFTTILEARIKEVIASKETNPKKLKQHFDDIGLLVRFCQSEIKKFPQGK